MVDASCLRSTWTRKGGGGREPPRAARSVSFSPRMPNASKPAHGSGGLVSLSLPRSEALVLQCLFQCSGASTRTPFHSPPALDVHSQRPSKELPSGAKYRASDPVLPSFSFQAPTSWLLVNCASRVPVVPLAYSYC